MLTIIIPEKELWDEEKQEFIYIGNKTLQMEHSLISISKWESKWNKAFLSNKSKTPEEVLDYIKCMTITQNVDNEIYNLLTSKNIEDINAYIEAPMTATYISNKNEKSNPGTKKDTVTSELIYYWMISFNIPFECQKWHLNRLLALIEVCNIKNQSPKKMGKKALYKQHSAINAANRKRFKTKG